jgi:hypothetical protein
MEEQAVFMGVRRSFCNINRLRDVKRFSISESVQCIDRGEICRNLVPDRSQYGQRNIRTLKSVYVYSFQNTSPVYLKHPNPIIST